MLVASRKLNYTKSWSEPQASSAAVRRRRLHENAHGDTNLQLIDAKQGAIAAYGSGQFDTS
jgi:hypothetical protein